MNAEICALHSKYTPAIREVCRWYFRKCRKADPDYVMELAHELFKKYGHRWIAYELIASHGEAFEHIGEAELMEFGRGINSWWTVDAFARTLSGPAWLERQVPDKLILKWAHSKDRWWRRAALVSTVALNISSHGGYGDTPRTLKVCRLLAADRDDMICKALSWALRALVVHDPEAVRKYLAKYDPVLAARVKYEVRNKLTIGLKNPGRRKH